MFVETHKFVPRFDAAGRLMISYQRPRDVYLKSQEKRSRTSRRPQGVLFLNRGTIVNTSPTVGRNRVVSIDGGAPVKLKRSQIARQPRPFTIRSRAR